MYFILSIILIAFGIFMLMRPRTFFELTERWKSDTNCEPSKLYLFGTRFGGVMCILAAVGELIALVFLS